MITIDQFKSMRKGTIIYISGIPSANNLSKEIFEEVQSYTSPAGKDFHHIQCKQGSYNYNMGLLCGVNCFIDFQEAKQYMQDFHERKHARRLIMYKQQLAAAQEKIDSHNLDAGLADYLYLDRTDDIVTEEFNERL